MIFLIDENAGPSVARFLAESGYDVLSVYYHFRGTDDDFVLSLALSERRILITADKDFGEKIFREKLPHHGVILLRLKDERTANKIATLQILLDKYTERFANHFMVVSENRIRFSGGTKA